MEVQSTQEVQHHILAVVDHQDTLAAFEVDILVAFEVGSRLDSLVVEVGILAASAEVVVGQDIQEEEDLHMVLVVAEACLRIVVVVVEPLGRVDRQEEVEYHMFQREGQRQEWKLELEVGLLLRLVQEVPVRVQPVVPLRLD